MTGRKSSVLGVHEAAKIIYGASEPSEHQLQQVKKWMARGMLKHLDKKCWSTTPDFVAEFLASQTYHQQIDQRLQSKTHRKRFGKSVIRHEDREQFRDSPELSSVYQDTLKEYLLAFVFQRNRKQLSKRFQRAVLLGQLCFISLIVFLCGSAFIGQLKSTPQEQVIVGRWIQEHEKEHEIIQWFPVEENSEGQGATVRVRYRYRNSRGKSVLTDRVFLVKDELAVPHEPDE